MHKLREQIRYICGVIDCNEWKTGKHHEYTNMGKVIHKYGESKTSRIMMATVHHVPSSSGLRKF